MPQVKDSGTPGMNHATMPVGAVLDGAKKTLTMGSGTNLPTGVVLRDQEWVILETRNIDGASNVIGECRYSENSAILADIATFANNLRSILGVFYTNFDLTVTHYKGGHIIDIYRGDGNTTVSLAVDDTDVAFAPPPFWIIDDITPFAPDTLVVNDNIIEDSGFDDPTKWRGTETPSMYSVIGSKLVFIGTDRVGTTPTEPLVEGALYELSIECKERTVGVYRFYIGDVSPSSMQSHVGVYTKQMVCPAGATTVSVQGVSGFVGKFDNFTCKRI